MGKHKMEENGLCQLNIVINNNVLIL